MKAEFDIVFMNLATNLVQSYSAPGLGPRACAPDVIAWTTRLAPPGTGTSSLAHATLAAATRKTNAYSCPKMGSVKRSRNHAVQW